MAPRKSTKAVEEVKAVVDGAVESAPKKTTRRTTKKKVKVTVNVEFQGMQHNITEVATKAEQAFKDGNPDVVIETLDIYCKPEEGVAYYVVNGEGKDEYKVEI